MLIDQFRAIAAAKVVETAGRALMVEKISVQMVSLDFLLEKPSICYVLI